MSAAGRLSFRAARGHATVAEATRARGTDNVTGRAGGKGGAYTGSKGVTASASERRSTVSFAVRSGGATGGARERAVAGLKASKSSGASVHGTSSNSGHGGTMTVGHWTFAPVGAPRRAGDLGHREDFEVGQQTWVSSHPRATPKYLRHGGNVRKDLRTELVVTDYSEV